MNETKACPRCGADVPQPGGRGRQPVYCSTTCRRQASREKRLAAGLCMACGQRPPVEGLTNCRPCKENLARYQRARYAAKPKPRCKTCGKEFDRGGNRQVYCSEACAPKTMRRLYDTKPCPYCTTSFAPKHERQPTCGATECKAEHRRAMKRKSHAKVKGCGQPRPCSHCGKDYIPTRLSNRYCSKKCRNRASVVRLGRHKAIPPRPCKKCGNEYQPSTHNQAYCGYKCREGARYTPKLAPRRCQICGFEFQPRQNRQIVCSERACQTERERQRYKPKVRQDEEVVDTAIVFGGAFTDYEQLMADDHNAFDSLWGSVYRKHQAAHEEVAAMEAEERRPCTPRYIHGLGVNLHQQVRQWLGIRKGGDDDPYRTLR